VELGAYDEVIVTLCFPDARFFHCSSYHVSRWSELNGQGQAEFELGHARRLGYAGPMPPTYAATSGRTYALPPRTVGLHPGSKPGGWMRLKRWAGLPALATALLEAGLGVAIVGTDADGSAHDAWPAGVLDFRGKLSLLDTAALLAQCRAVVANDSGIAHLSAAAGTETVIVFGPTSERIYARPRANAHPIAADVPCRPCHNPSHCEDQVCLSRLRPARVMEAVRAVLT
jgi:ADP-heptose:LPS heptosyltransferase